PVRGRLDRAQPAEGTDEERLDAGQAGTADHLAVQPHATLARDVQDVADDRDTAARALRHRVGVPGRDEPDGTARLAVAGRVGTLAPRPAVVAALLDQIGLVHRAVAELLLPQVPIRVEGEPLRVAVPVAPDGVVERVVRRN